MIRYACSRDIILRLLSSQRVIINSDFRFMFFLLRIFTADSYTGILYVTGVTIESTFWDSKQNYLQRICVLCNYRK